MSNGWTGGQYSVYRAIFGIYLFIHFVMILPWSAELFSNRGVLPADASPFLKLFPNVLAVSDAPAAVAALIVIGAIGAICFFLGLYDRTAAVLMWYVLACLFGRNPLISNPSLPFVGWLLLAHLFVPPAPYGSWPARKRTDPRGGWIMPSALFAAAWFVMSAGYSYSGYTKLVSPSWVDGTALTRVLSNPLARPTFLRDFLLVVPDLGLRVATWGTLALELLYLPLAFFRRARPWLWTAMLALHFGLMVLIDFADLSFGMIVLHLFTFDPQWVPGRWRERKDQIFYDGTCGLCHRGTRFVLAEDPGGSRFLFAPLQGETFAAAMTVEQRAALPDSVVVRTETGELLTRSEAALYILQRLGGMWRVIAMAMRLVPGGLRNVVYDFIARIRYRLFARPKTACPLLPPDLRARFQA
jgi:predicted DCC family thiol-disulfide oxidoreductase YuxK